MKKDLDKYIKDKLGEFKPEFKEEYWQAASALLKSNKRKKRLIWFWLMATGAMAVVIYITMSDSKINDKPLVEKSINSIAIDQSLNKKKVFPYAENAPDSLMNSIKTEIISNNNSPSDIAVVVEHNHTKSIDKLQDKENNPTPGKPIGISSTEMDISGSTPASDRLYLVDELNKLTEKNPKATTGLLMTNQPNMDMDYQNQASSILAVRESNNYKTGVEEDRIRYSALSPLDYLAIPFMRNDILIKGIHLSGIRTGITRKVYPHNNWNAIVRFNVLISDHEPAYWDLEAGCVLSGYLNHNWNAGIGILGGYAQAQFQYADQVVADYYGFGANKYQQILNPESAIYGKLTLFTELRASRWSAKIAVEPEYLVALRGKKITEYHTSLFKISSGSGEIASEISTDRESKDTWISDQYISNFSLSANLELEYRLSKKISLGARISTYVVQPFRYTDDQSFTLQTNALSEKQIIKGGVYAIYPFHRGLW